MVHKEFFKVAFRFFTTLGLVLSIGLFFGSNFIATTY